MNRKIAKKGFLSKSQHNHVAVEIISVATSEDNSNNRSSCSQMFFKAGALKNFANLIGKHLWWSLISKKNADLQVCHLIKKTLQYKSFPVKFEEFLGTSIFTEHLFLQSISGCCLNNKHASSHQRLCLLEKKLNTWRSVMWSRLFDQ